MIGALKSPGCRTRRPVSGEEAVDVTLMLRRLVVLMYVNPRGIADLYATRWILGRRERSRLTN
jgi:hypothetical protein